MVITIMIEKVRDLVGRLHQTTHSVIVFIYIPKLQFFIQIYPQPKHTALTSCLINDTLPGRFK